MVDAIDVALAAAVKMVIHSDKPNTEERKHTGYIVANGNVIPAESGQVLYYDALDAPVLSSLQKSFYTRPVEVFPLYPSSQNSSILV